MAIILQPSYDLATDAASISQALRQLELGLEQEIADRIAGDEAISGSGTLAFADVSGKPTTLAGYGIVDGQPLADNLSEVAALPTETFGLGTLTQSTASDARAYIGVTGAEVTPAHTPEVDSQFLAAYDNSTGAFTQSPLPSLDLVPAPVADVSLAGFKVVDLAPPTNDNDAASKLYVDALSTGMIPHEAVQAATTADITLSAPQTIDDYSAIATDRILVKDQADPKENGIYTVNAGAWTRTTDADADAEIVNMSVFVLDGTVNAGSTWFQSTIDAEIAVDDIVFLQVNALTAYSAGVGLDLVGTQFALEDMAATTLKGNNTGSPAAPADLSISDVRTMLALDQVENTTLSTWAGTTDLTTLGTVTTGTWSASTIALNKGGTGATTQSTAAINILPSQTSNKGKVLTTDGTNVSWQESLYVNVKSGPFNAVGNGIANDTTAINAALATLSAGGVCFFPAGTYLVNTTGITIPADKVQIVGAGKGATTIKAIMDMGVNNAGLIHCDTKSGWTMKDLTVDMNHMQGSGILVITSDNWTMRDSEVINIKHYGIIIDGGSKWRIMDNYFLKTDPTGTYQNQAILSIDTSGDVASYYVKGNELDGSGMFMLGHHSHIVDNRVSNVQYGSGIITGVSTGTYQVVVSGNICAFGSGTDIDGKDISGFEIDSPDNVVQGNIAYFNAGSGFISKSKNSINVGNLAKDNAGVAGVGFSLIYEDSDTNSSGSVFVGNRAYNTDNTSGPQEYGFAQYDNALVSITQSGNNWIGNKLGSALDTGTASYANDVGITRTFAWTPGTIAADQQTSAPTLIGASGGNFTLGDTVLVSSDLDLLGCVLFGYVSSSNQITILLHNTTNAVKHFSSAMNIYVRVIKKQSAPNY